MVTLVGCGIGQDSDIIGINGMDDAGTQNSGDPSALMVFYGNPDATTEPTDVYDPCAGKVCGDACQVCDPDDEDCIDTDGRRPVVRIR